MPPCSSFLELEKAAANTRERQPQPYYFKRPVDCDDEESLEEGRGRTVLRTAMLSTRADRYYGPPDGIQPEFDLLSRLNRFRDRAANCIGQFTPRLKPKYGDALGDERYIIILVRERRASHLFMSLLSRNCVKQTVCRWDAR